MDTRLIDAVHRNDMRQVIALLAFGVPVDIRGDHGETALMRAATDANVRMVDFLLGKNARVDLKDFWEGFPLNYAVRNHSLSITRTLVAHKADVNATGRAGVTALMDASDYGSTDIAAFLIKQGAKVNAQAYANGSTALIQATYFHKYDCIKLLLANGADKSLRDRQNETALSYAQKNHDSKAIELLK